VRCLEFSLLFLMLVSIFSGCVPMISHNIVTDYKERMPTSIAVLPIQNETVDMDAPKIFRHRLVSTVFHKGYVSPPEAEIDSKLLERDIREAGQLGSMTPQEIGKHLNIDALLYTTVTQCSTVYLVSYASLKVGARFKLIDVKTGEQLWGSEHEVVERKLCLDEDSIEECLTFAILQEYDPYVKILIGSAFSILPNGPKYVSPRKRPKHIPRKGLRRHLYP